VARWRTSAISATCSTDPAAGGGYGIATIYTSAANPRHRQALVGSPLPDAAGNLFVGLDTHSLVEIAPPPGQPRLV
jgi:hypothetical protein